MLSGWLAASPLYSPASSSYTYAGICIRHPTHGGAIECFVNGPELLSKVGDGGFQAARSISFSPSLNLTPSTISARR